MSEVSGNGAGGGISRLRPGTLFAAMFLFCFLVRLPLLLFPPAGFYYSMDELMVAFCALDRFLGLPPTILMLPSTFLQFLFLPLFLVDMVIRQGLPLNTSALLSELSVQLSQACLNPHHPVLLMRCLVAVLCSAGPVFAYGISIHSARRHGLPCWVRRLSCLIPSSFDTRSCRELIPLPSPSS